MGSLGRFQLLAGIRSLFLLFAMAVCPSFASAESRPNFLVILVDTLRADYLGCYGFKGPISPNIDTLARGALVFDRCIAQAPWTKPSVASLFTSLHPFCHGVFDPGNPSPA